MVEKKPVFLRRDFKCDEIARPKTILKRTYPATKLVSLYKTKCSLRQSNADKYPPSVNSDYVLPVDTYMSNHVSQKNRKNGLCPHLQTYTT